MLSQFIRFLSFVVLLFVVACGGGGGGAPADNPPDNTIHPDPVLVGLVDSAVDNADSPDVDLEDFYGQTALNSPATSVISYLSALKNADAAADMVDVMLGAGSVFGYTENAAKLQALTYPCENSDVSVWFVNGIWTDPWGALISLRELRRAIKNAGLGIPESDIKLFYNKSGVTSGSISRNICEYIVGANAILGARYNETSDMWREFIGGVCGTLVDFAEAASQWVDQWISYVPDFDAPQVQEFRALVQQDVSAGKAVVLVGHSQGNFFIQRAMEGLPMETQANVGVVALASPAKYDSQNSYGYFDHLTVYRDVVCGVPGTLKENLHNEREVSGANELEIHSFADSYIGSPTSRQRSVDMIASARNMVSLGANSSSGYLQASIVWDHAGDVNLDVIELDEVAWVHNDEPLGEIGYLAKYDDNWQGPEVYVVCDKKDLRPGCYKIRAWANGVPAGTKVDMTIRAGSSVFTESGVVKSSYNGPPIVIWFEMSFDGRRFKVYGLSEDCRDEEFGEILPFK